MIRLPALAGSALLLTTLLGGTADAVSPPFAGAVFRATHNSYSGNVDGAKNSLAYQLDHGVRFVELDVHDNGYGTDHDYAVGHDSPGNLVDHSGGNPASNHLRDWLATVDTWSAAHPTAAPIVVMVDLKDDLTDNPSFADGNLTALNQELESVFGPRLLRAQDYPANPAVDALRGRVLALLSGESGTRAEYKRDVGYHPAVALNGRGQVVEVHDSGAGALWYWTGTYGADGRVTWLRHGRYDSGQTPAVALNDNGDLVEVHQSQSATTLWSRVGKLGADGEITWQAGRQYDNGVLPGVVFTDAAGTRLREIHRSQSGSQNWTWTGVLGGTAVSWSGNAKTSDARFPTATAVNGTRRVTVRTAADGPAPAQTLRADTAAVTGDRIRYRQVAFDEFQQGDSAELQDGALFYGAPATASAFLTAARQAGKLVRGWDFDSAGLATTPLVSYPATNHPYDTWYENLLTQNGAVQ